MFWGMFWGAQKVFVGFLDFTTKLPRFLDIFWKKKRLPPSSPPQKKRNFLTVKLISKFIYLVYFDVNFLLNLYLKFDNCLLYSELKKEVIACIDCILFCIINWRCGCWWGKYFFQKQTWDDENFFYIFS